MNSRTLGLRIAGTIFGLMGLVQLMRLVTHFKVVIGGFHLPLWPSAVAVVVAGGLSVWLWKLSKNGA